MKESLNKNIDKTIDRFDRPYYILDDNETSKIYIKKITSSYFLDELKLDEDTATAINDKTFFDTPYLTQVRKQANK